MICEGPCKGVTAEVTSSSGDPDLYAREYEPPEYNVRYVWYYRRTIISNSMVSAWMDL